MNAVTAQPLLSVREAARLLSISVRTVYALVERGELPAVRIGDQIRFVPSVLETWLADQRTDEQGT
jgi:excisionase family DNA binding protein